MCSRVSRDDYQTKFSPDIPTTTPSVTSSGTVPLTVPPAPTTPPLPVTTVPAFTSFQLVGQANSSITDKFRMDKGFATFSFSHQSQRGNFIVTLLDSSGQRVEGLVNEIGLFAGTVPVIIPSTGTYVLEVRAAGLWSVVVNEPRSAVGTPLPFTQTGTGPTIAGPFRHSGVVRVSSKHSGCQISLSSRIRSPSAATAS